MSSSFIIIIHSYANGEKQVKKINVNIESLLELDGWSIDEEVSSTAFDCSFEFEIKMARGVCARNRETLHANGQ